MLESEIALIAGFAMVLMFCLFGNRQGRASDPIS